MSEGNSSRTPSETGSAMRTVRSYSDIVRASSPESDHISQEKQPTAAAAVVSTEADSSVNISDEPSMEQAAYEMASENSESPSSEDGDDRPWTTVARKRNKGQEIRMKEPESDQAKRPDKLMDKQRTAIHKAEGRLTEAERTKLALREEKVRQALESGPSKGKGTDPQNWGGIQFVPEEIDLAAQKAALESYRLAKRQEEMDSEQRESRSESDCVPPSEATKRRIEKALQGLEKSLRLEYERELAAGKLAGSDPVKAVINKVVKPSTERRERHPTPQVMEPVHQVAPHSYIGQALGHIDRKGKGSDDPDSSSSESPDSSDSSDEGSSQAAKQKKCKHSKKSSKKKKRKTTLKPIPPATYDGAVNSRAFHRFITEGTAYVEDGRVSLRKKVFILSHFLKGKAHEFYIREVLGNPYRWRLHDFFTELFNYCFPINFRTKQCEKLKHCFQNEKSVRDYVYELKEL
ncbi:hypothetical protein M405DRAFT_864199 [Rhizopogon salebrosus TDB-379]|nr:hypothetical protein M405DRAFT_864199 [Rhizopogon salebrosus TDB-379]